MGVYYVGAVSALKRKGLFINLKTCNSFADIKVGLIREIENLEQITTGMNVTIDLGDKSVNTKQVREIEDVLLDYGLYLKELKANPVAEKPTDEATSENNVFSDMTPYEKTTLICKNLRSGQKVFSQGNVVILGDINPGAEVIAKGNILVMGTLRGMAHAGVFGDEKAIIAAYRLNPTQIRIANHITRPPDGESIVVKSPELARIRAGKVIIEKLKI